MTDNSAAIARFFYLMLKIFIYIILHYSDPDKGLFRNCVIYYNIVKA